METLGAGRRAGQAARKEAGWWGEEGGGEEAGSSGAKKATAATHGPEPQALFTKCFSVFFFRIFDAAMLAAVRLVLE